MYLAKVNAELKAKSGGQRSLDTLVLEILKRQRTGGKVGLAEWRSMIVKELGPAANQEYEDMEAGKLIVPPEDSFGPCFKAVSEPEQPFDLGFDEMRLGVVKNLREDSAADKAGVREGDTIVSITPLDLVRNDPKKLMELKLNRGERELSVGYSPRSATVPAWHWERKNLVKASDCKL